MQNEFFNLLYFQSILKLMLFYFYLNTILKSGLLLVVEYFKIIVFVLATLVMTFDKLTVLSVIEKLTMLNQKPDRYSATLC